LCDREDIQIQKIKTDVLRTMETWHKSLDTELSSHRIQWPFANCAWTQSNHSES